MKDKMTKYLEKRIQEIDRWLSTEKFKDVEPHEMAELDDQYDLVGFRAERKALVTTLKYVKSVRFK